MKKIFSLIAITVALLVFSEAAKAAPMVFTTTLSGANEVPPVISPGVGNAIVTVDGNIMTVNANFSGLLSNTIAAHIHCCVPPGVNAMVATTTPSFPGFPLGVTSGLLNPLRKPHPLAVGMNERGAWNRMQVWLSEELHTPFTILRITWSGHRNIASRFWAPRLGAELKDYSPR